VTAGAWSGPRSRRRRGGRAGYFSTAPGQNTFVDPRPSLEECYGKLWEYYFLTIQNANNLVEDQLLLPDEVNRLLNQMLYGIARLEPRKRHHQGALTSRRTCDGAAVAWAGPTNVVWTTT